MTRSPRPKRPPSADRSPRGDGADVSSSASSAGAGYQSADRSPRGDGAGSAPEPAGRPRAAPSALEALSDPPRLTAYPNPALASFVREARRDPAPIPTAYAGDFGVDARNPVYLYHPYHTKVPPGVIQTLIEHYTREGELVLDVFAGSGMTGVAACAAGRRSIVLDLSPVATFVAGINTRAHDLEAGLEAARSVIDASERELGWAYETREGDRPRGVGYFVRTDVFACPACLDTFPFFPHGVIHHGHKVETRRAFPCPHCDAELNVRRVERVLERDGKRSVTAWVTGGRGQTRFGRPPNDHDAAVERRVAQALIDGPWYPTDPIDPRGYSARLAQLGAKRIDNVAKLLSPRNRLIFADLWQRAREIADGPIRRLVQSVLTSMFTVVSERQGYFGGGGGMSGNLYMPIVRMERNPWDSARRKLNRLAAAEVYKRENYRSRAVVSTQSATDLANIPDDSVHYIYTDPPFGANIIYSEMNLALEAWLEVRTEPTTEAVVDQSRARTAEDYARLMHRAFTECFRVLAPGRWITVEFHNTKAEIWNVIQLALTRAGFAVAQVGILDKGSTTILADIRPGAAKHDLLIHAYKPTTPAAADSGSAAVATGGDPMAFVRDHLARLPPHGTEDQPVVTERLPAVLYDRFLAHHVSRGWPIPLSSEGFLDRLASETVRRNGMVFLADQLPEYERWRDRVDPTRLEQGASTVGDEASALAWLRAALDESPRRFADLQPEFITALAAWPAHEPTPELADLLQENFLRYDGDDEIPEQILSGLSKRAPGGVAGDPSDPALVEKARGRWYVPDPEKREDLDRLRQRALLRTFDGYARARGRLEVVRAEAIRAGFGRCWRAHDYATIVAVGGRLPPEVLQQDPALQLYFDNARSRLGEG